MSSLRFWLKGPKAGTKEIIMDNMIGYPDNIRLSDHETFLVGITTTRFRKLTPPFLDMIAPYPAVKRFLAKVGLFHSVTAESRIWIRTNNKMPKIITLRDDFNLCKFNIKLYLIMQEQISRIKMI